MILTLVNWKAFPHFAIGPFIRVGMELWWYMGKDDHFDGRKAVSILKYFTSQMKIIYWRLRWPLDSRQYWDEIGYCNCLFVQSHRWPISSEVQNIMLYYLQISVLMGGWRYTRFDKVFVLSAFWGWSRVSVLKGIFTGEPHFAFRKHLAFNVLLLFDWGQRPSWKRKDRRRTDQITWLRLFVTNAYA